MNAFDKNFFSSERWAAAIDKGIGKDIRRDQLIQLTKPEVRETIYRAMMSGKYRISPPHIAEIPKDTPGEFRQVYVNEPMDRILLSIANDMLFDWFGDMVHPNCKSYQKGIGCGKVVQEVARRMSDGDHGKIIGWKSDLSKYFDSVPIQYIDEVFAKMRERIGESVVLDVVQMYYHSDLYFDTDGHLCEKYQSLKQGCAVAAFLADVVINHIDEKLNALTGFYVRYSDDMLYIGEDHEAAMDILAFELGKMGMKLNPKKVEALTADRWFKFLGFSIKGSQISLSGSRIKRFQEEISARTTRAENVTPDRALKAVNRFLYVGDGEHSWATQVLPVINVKNDLLTLNGYVLDSLRAVQTGKTQIGGLGYVPTSSFGCISRGTGKNVRANREKTEATIEGYRTLSCMRQALTMTRPLYDSIVRQLPQ